MKVLCPPCYGERFPDGSVPHKNVHISKKDANKEKLLVQR